MDKKELNICKTRGPRPYYRPSVSPLSRLNDIKTHGENVYAGAFLINANVSPFETSGEFTLCEIGGESWSVKLNSFVVEKDIFDLFTNSTDTSYSLYGGSKTFTTPLSIFGNKISVIIGGDVGFSTAEQYDFEIDENSVTFSTNNTVLQGSITIKLNYEV